MRRLISMAVATVTATAAILLGTAGTAHADTAVFTKASEWGGGYTGQYRVTNTGTATLPTWKVEFDLPAGSSVGSYWDALMVKTGNHYTFTNRNYNGNLAPNASAVFGWVNTGTGVPLNCKLNGAPCEGPGDTQAPTVPTGLAVDTRAQDSIGIRWNASVDNSGSIARYEVSRNDGAAVQVPGTTLTFLATGLATDSAHTFKVRACDSSNNCSAYTANLPARTLGPNEPSPPTIPGNVAVGNPTRTSLTVTWSASTDNVGVVRYDVSRDNGTPVQVLGNTLTYTANGLTANTPYAFKVRACDASNDCSPYSDPVSGTTLGDVPPPGEIRYAPYIDITRPTPSMATSAAATGVKNYTLAFALGSSTGCTPTWGGTIPINDTRIINDVRAIQGMGGQVVVATGGAVGPYLEHVCGTTASLLAAYKQVLDLVGTNHLDVDVEASIDANKVNAALKQLQTERGTVVSYTLRIQGQDYGVDPFSYSILQDAAAKGLDVHVNPMLMNFGYTGDWGTAMTAAAQATLNQMKAIWPAKTDAQLKKRLGVIPMIGRNDTGMTTTQANARTLLTWANANQIAFIGFWSTGRDNGGCPNGQVLPSCSGVAQSTWEFTNIFKGFTG
ncbi:cellulose binding domain-containing protein [Rhizohabitans arisaemae]|uniref:cellulose binding domain-containing protein n=1 Tax=Rhizohabitans arisaemae TaxID=2720610 RepID=UPI0024B102DA|nr:cellulose binding domain-containing protein [Rhizohabitans arisaemae]